MAKSEPQRVPVTLRSVIQRINRKLAARNGYVLKVTRGSRWRDTLGDYYTVNGNAIVEKHINPEELARELGALKDWEEVQQ